MNIECEFENGDPTEFREFTKFLLQRGGASNRRLTAKQYLSLCRKLWSEIKTNDLYTHKYLEDETFSGRSQEIYGCAVATIHVECDKSGTVWREPDNYAELRHQPLGTSYRELIFVYPAGSLRAEPEAPEISHQTVALFDLLGFEKKLEDMGLAAMYEKYQDIIHKTFVPSVAENKYSEARGVFAGELRDGVLKLPIRHAYFSDTLLMWAPYHNAFTGVFLDRCSSLFCNALDVGFPLRGAISVSDVVFHKKTGTYLGDALVESARLEAAQDTIGVALGKSVRSIVFPPDRVQRFDQPVKPKKEELLSGLVLDWPKYWRDFMHGDPIERLNSLRAAGFEKYYDHAVDFVNFSKSNTGWFMAEIEKQIGPFTVA